MVVRAQFASAAGLLLIAWPAWASSTTGMLTLLVGIPSLLVAAAVLVLMLRRPRTPSSVRLCIGLLALPVLYDLLLVPDAISLVRDGPRVDAGIAVAFFGLLVLVCGLGLQLVRLNRG
jgi:hypothetical protein